MLARILVGSLFVALCSAPLSAQQAAGPAPAGGQKHLFQYKMQQDETLRWEVLHEVEFDTTVSGTTQRARTYSKSVKAWRVIDAKASGKKFTFQHIVEGVHMWQELTGRARVEWKGPSEDTVPPGFESVAATLGKPLYVVELDVHGNILNRRVAHTGPGLEAASEDRQITIPFPSEAIPVGHVWHLEFDFRVADDSGKVKKFSARDQFKLKSVKDGIATLSTETQILTPVRDPAIEAQILQRGGRGEIQFDIEGWPQSSASEWTSIRAWSASAAPPAASTTKAASSKSCCRPVSARRVRNRAYRPIEFPRYLR